MTGSRHEVPALCTNEPLARLRVHKAVADLKSHTEFPICALHELAFGPLAAAARPLPKLVQEGHRLSAEASMRLQHKRHENVLLRVAVQAEPSNLVISGQLRRLASVVEALIKLATHVLMRDSQVKEVDGAVRAHDSHV